MQPPCQSEALKRAIERQRFYDSHRNYLPVLQPPECRAVIGPQRAAAKCAAYNALREKNLEVVLRSASSTNAERVKASLKAQAQRDRVQRLQRLVANDAIKRRGRVAHATNLIYDDVVEAALVSISSVHSADKKELVLKGLTKMLPPLKQRPALL